MIIDKDKSFADALAERLKACDFLTAGITSGAQFFQISSQFQPNIIILSTDLQNPTWAELIERSKQSSLFKEGMIFILITREASPGLENQAKLHEIKKIIVKPVNFKDLVETIDKKT